MLPLDIRLRHAANQIRELQTPGNQLFTESFEGHAAELCAEYVSIIMASKKAGDES